MSDAHAGTILNKRTESVEDFARILDVEFQKIELLQAALTHKSYYFEVQESSSNQELMHNEKLEFLGDAVLDLILSEFLMELFPDDSEGSLSKKRASLVNETVLAAVAVDLQIANYILLGKGEFVTGGNKKPRILSSAYEAILGAIFIDQGFQKVRMVARKHFAKVISEIDPKQDFVADYKTRLQEVVQSEKRASPTYKVILESGPAHDREFHVHLYIQEALLAEGKGKSKKSAEQDAAKNALHLFKNQGRIS